MGYYPSMEVSVMTREEITLPLIAATGSPTPGTIVGITRLQKLLFLTEKETGITPSEKPFEFTAYKFGPVSKKVYDDLCLLEHLGLLESSANPQPPKPRTTTDPMRLDPETLLSPASLSSSSTSEISDDEDELNIESHEMDVFRVTPRGMELLHKKGLLETPEYKKIEVVKKRHGARSLSDLLRYVYTHYEDYTTESEIKDQVL